MLPFWAFVNLKQKTAPLQKQPLSSGSAASCLRCRAAVASPLSLPSQACRSVVVVTRSSSCLLGWPPQLLGGGRLALRGHDCLALSCSAGLLLD
ncbi:hypothetical protein Ddye_029897 [Dipteronia dyeriana]|uniref:Uncharacterized protein n=1 Tax=Dipteronia dyeriana TaxID=168575 RepID=A0AAD9TFA2_9ROSI|nr:hypothetical protein Ddye_029897 [Dipteronia dyeriana]